MEVFFLSGIFLYNKKAVNISVVKLVCKNCPSELEQILKGGTGLAQKKKKKGVSGIKKDFGGFCNKLGVNRLELHKVTDIHLSVGAPLFSTSVIPLQTRKTHSCTNINFNHLLQQSQYGYYIDKRSGLTSSLQCLKPFTVSL